MLETSARLLRLLSLLQTPREWTGAELGERLGVSPRTVRNDVDKLRELGYPVLATRGAAAGTGSARARRCRRCCSTTRRPSPSPSGSGPWRRSDRRDRGGSLRALAKLEQVLPSRLRTRVGGLRSIITPVHSRRPRRRLT